MPAIRKASEIRKARQRLDRAIVGVALSLVGVFASIIVITT